METATKAILAEIENHHQAIGRLRDEWNAADKVEQEADDESKQQIRPFRQFALVDKEIKSREMIVELLKKKRDKIEERVLLVIDENLELTSVKFADGVVFLTSTIWGKMVGDGDAKDVSIAKLKELKSWEFLVKANVNVQSLSAAIREYFDDIKAEKLPVELVGIVAFSKVRKIVSRKS